MLRPATPLTVLLLAAFAMLLISVLSTPIIKNIPLASFDGVDFGVSGFCKGSTCSGFKIGYSTASLFSDTEAASFELPTSTRKTLSAILIVHPIAALFTLVMMVLATVAHLHSPSHSPRYLLGIFILSILTLILALLSFLIDVLLFVPHMAWGSYLVLAATVLIAASGIVSCAMRRTLVSRKARKRRIAENAEMNGENFYNRQAATAPTLVNTTSTAMVSGGVVSDKPDFAAFESAKKDGESDEQLPLTAARSPSERSPIGMPGQAMDMPPRNQSPMRDQYGNPIPGPPGAYGMQNRDPSADSSIRRQYSDTSMNSRGRGGAPPGYRGRGGFPPNGRGGYSGPPRGGYGGYPPRGGYGPPRGGYGPPGRGGYGPPRGGYGGPGGPGGPGMAPMGMGPPMPGGMRGGRGPAPNYGPNSYGRDRSPPGSYDDYAAPPGSGPGPYGRNQSPPPVPGGYVPYPGGVERRDSLPRAESPPPLPDMDDAPPIGQAVEMDATATSSSQAPKGFGNQFGNIRDSDGDVAGMVGLQQQRLMPRETVMSQSSMYSSDEPYLPPRAAWGDNPPPGRSGSPLNPLTKSPELPNMRKRTSSGYYEDVDPRFVDQAPIDHTHPSLIPTALHPFGQDNIKTTTVNGLDGNNSYEDLQDGARSPAESERSNFTSVSQRGINPRWNGGGNGYNPPMPNRRPVPPRQNDMLLNSNPDFQLPGNRGGRPGRGGRGGGAPGMIPNGPYPG